MTCKCCSKKFPSYKFFMGHMRKKYHGLPRNVCFKCLRQFDSKGQFIGHLKRPGNSCPNLYRLVMADDSIPKNLLPTDTNLRIPAKDVLNNRVYACALCDDTFRLKSDFREHVYGVHLEVTKNRETPNASCINCNEAFTDSAVRRRHFNNLDCIVYIVCNTCGEQFPSQSVYLEHVYQTHLNAKENEVEEESILFEEPPEEQINQQASTISPGNKSIQKCPVCNKQYNNYYNVLRHMEAKHPDQVPQTYQCPECPNEKFSKQTYLRDHLIKVHNKVDVSQRELMQHQINNNHNNNGSANNSSIQNLCVYSCKAPNCNEEFREKNKWLDHQKDEHNDQYFCMFCNQYESKGGSREDFEKHLEEIHQNSLSKSSNHILSTTIDSDDDEGSNSNKLSSDQTQSFKCRLCAKRIATKTGLQKHMIKVHNVGGELVKCTLCPADFANDKGLKVHLWRCHEIREADYENVLPPDLLDPYTQQQRKLKQEEEQKSIVMANESGHIRTKQIVYECPFCHIVYHSKEEHINHQKTTHAMDDLDVLDPEDFIQHDYDEGNVGDEEDLHIAHVTGDDDNNEQATIQPEEEQEYWFQCRFCQRSFNSSKKLTIHMNSHQESSNGKDENGGYPCKECNIVYKSKKSLWVHRHKKHPRHPVPSHCDSCEKTFFDQNELMLHMQHAHPGNIPIINNTSLLSNQQKENESSLFTEGHWLLDSSTEIENSRMKAPQSVDGNNSLLSQPKKRKRPAPSETADGQFACDMCPKCFSNANALQVHRGWHFRSPDGRKVKDPSQMWHPDQTPPSKVRRTGTPSNVTTISTMTTAPNTNNLATTLNTVPICPHCNTKFASHNNLRRHIIEVHKTRETNNGNGGGAGGVNNEACETKVDRAGECTRCNVSFSTVAEWVQHKINDAKNRKMTQAGYEWNCEICLKPFTRRERLMQHMLSHLNDREIDPEVLAEYNNSKKSLSQSSFAKNGRAAHQDLSSDEESAMQEDEDEDMISDEELESQSDNENVPKKKGVGKSQINKFSCDMCNVKFSSSQDLRAHVVAEHFLNGSSSASSSSTIMKTNKSSAAAANTNVKSRNYKEVNDNVDDDDDDVGEKKLQIDEEIERELDNVEFEEAEIDFEDDTSNNVNDSDNEQEEEEEENSTSDSSSSSLSGKNNAKVLAPTTNAVQQQQPPLARIQVQLHRCRICNSAFLEQMKSVKCMLSHQDRVTSFKCNECQLYFKDSNQMTCHENLCHS